MRRKDREMPESFALDVLDRCAYAVIAMTDENGEPYCIPFSPIREGMRLYFHCAREGKKTDLLRISPKVCVTCTADVRPASDKFTVYYSSAVIRGTAAEVTDDGEKINALRLICEKYTPDNTESFSEAIERSLPRTAVWRIDIAEATGKRKIEN